MFPSKPWRWKRIILWLAVGVYTLALPQAILAYNALATRFPAAIVKLVPLAFISLLLLAYVALSTKWRLSSGKKLLILPCALIASLVIYLEPNSNKTIHIPEYILMTWLLFEALRIDYRGKGILILVLLTATLLGIMDELIQGVLKARFFAARDILVNGAAEVIGILTLMGLRKMPRGDWSWLADLRYLNGLMGVNIWGLIALVPMIIYLTRIKASGMIAGIYPPWLVMTGILFVLMGLIFVLVQKVSLNPSERSADCRHNAGMRPISITAYLWMVVPLTLLVIIHTTVALLVLGGFEFQ